MYGTSAPPILDAAEIDAMSDTVYLLHGNTLYVFSFTKISSVELSYAFVRKVDITSNVADNPFLAGPVSSLSHAPNNMDAMWLYDDKFVAVVKHWMYHYDLLRQSWQYEGTVKC